MRVESISVKPTKWLDKIKTRGLVKDNDVFERQP